MSVSVVIPVYNGSRFVVAAVRSALEQTHVPADVVVVDDGSTDGTADLLTTQFGPRIQLLRRQNGGVSVARNVGVEVATGELIAFLDADDEWLPNKLERQVAALTANPELGLVHCGVEDIDDSGTSLACHLDGMAGWVATDLVLLQRPVILGGGSGIVVRRRVLDAVGRFDPRLSTSADWDLFVRIAARYPVGFVPEVLLRYRRHGASMSANVELMRRDMSLALHKAFLSGNVPRKVRRRAYARLHIILAGSHFAAGRPQNALPHLLRAAVLQPRGVPAIVSAATRRLS